MLQYLISMLLHFLVSTPCCKISRNTKKNHSSVLWRACLEPTVLIVLRLRCVFFKLELALPWHMLVYSKAWINVRILQICGFAFWIKKVKYMGSPTYSKFTNMIPRFLTYVCVSGGPLHYLSLYDSLKIYMDFSRILKICTVYINRAHFFAYEAGGQWMYKIR